ncbi:unnamed protein product [Rotaria sp. Silwood2]|nr:unnamed protein product [Rotaria sp. Silwood2]CAF2706736.1 unnamed protein product [Rotaria sp. Silwood2]CAF2967085.1 unnamed protein product [Rotaria sp. Silwood2]CAF3111326.1 unnamed protein product [Rotaria sp. Silwood2]CAF3864665.1 unnamed protein product [Rotaria sp. Silwood2]
MTTSVSYLSYVQQILTRYGMSTYVAFGNLGNLLASAVFCQSEQRKSACSLYLLLMSICNLLCLDIAIIPIIYSLDHIDITSASLIGCRTQFYFRHAFFQMMRTYKTLACVDRYAICSTNVRYRLFSQRRVAIYIIIGSALFWLLAVIFFAWARTIQHGSCNIYNETYLMIYTIYYMIFTGILPPLLMIIFSVLVMKTLRKLRSRVQPKRGNRGNSQSINVIRKRDRDLMKMIFTEVMFYVITTMPYSIYLIYKVITDSLIKSQQQKQIETFINYMVQSFMLYFNTAASFYIYIATSPAFRRELKKVFIKFYAFIMRKQIRDEQDTIAQTITARA